MDMNLLTTIAMIVLMFGAFYFLIIRPQRKRQAQQRETIESLEPGARVLTSTGIYATLVRIGEKQAVIELSQGHEMTVVKHAIVRVVQPGDEDLEMDGPRGGGIHDDDLDNDGDRDRDLDRAEDPAAGAADSSTSESGSDDDFPWADRDDRRNGGA